jgi:hypothetical protein
MDEFISLVTSQLGIGESESRSATGGILKMLKDQLDESTFSNVINQLPGASSLLTEAESGAGQAAGGGGLMGSLASMAGSLLGGSSSAGGIMKALADAGIGLDKAGGFLSALVTFLKEKLGDEMFGTLAAKLPDLLGSARN